MSAYGQSIENSTADDRDRRARRAAAAAGGLCRCVACCCEPGAGHNHPAWQEFEAEERAHERFVEALERGLSDAEAREEGWPSGKPCGHGSNSRCECYGEVA